MGDLSSRAVAATFFAACGLGIAGCVFTVVEMLGAVLMQRWVFGIGPVAMVSKDPCDRPVVLVPSSTGRTGQLQYRIVAPNRCLLRDRLVPSPFRWEPRGALKGMVSWADGNFTTVARYPLGLTVSLFAGVLASTTGAAIAISRHVLAGLFPLAIGWGVVAILVIHVRLVQLRRFKESARELRALLQANPQARS
jgi:hypothetical protein